MKILGIISSLQDPASRARIIQYKEPLAEENIELSPRFFTPSRDADPAPWTYRLKKLTGISEWRISNTMKTMARLPLLFQQYHYDLIWQNRLLLPHHFYFEKKFNRPVVFDYDDAIWLDEGEKQVGNAIEKAALVFAGNEYLAAFGSRFNKNIHLVPSTVDTKRLYPLKKEGIFTLGWIGTKSNFPYLDLVKPAILDFLHQSRDTRFIIVSSEKPPGFNFDNERILFRTWDADKENEHINEFTVGLMPLIDNAYTKGKCSYKMLQYMACGKPVVVSPVGTNNKILAEDEVGIAAAKEQDWLHAFVKMKNDTAFYNSCAEKARKTVENKYASADWCKKIIPLFKQTVRA